MLPWVTACKILLDAGVVGLRELDAKHCPVVEGGCGDVTAMRLHMQLAKASRGRVRFDSCK